MLASRKKNQGVKLREQKKKREAFKDKFRRGAGHRNRYPVAVPRTRLKIMGKGGMGRESEAKNRGEGEEKEGIATE